MIRERHHFARFSMCLERHCRIRETGIRKKRNIAKVAPGVIRQSIIRWQFAHPEKNGIQSVPVQIRTQPSLCQNPELSKRNDDLHLSRGMT